MQSVELLSEEFITVNEHPVVELFVRRSAGPAHRPLLVIHGGPDWDHTYLLEPLVRLAGRHRVIFADLRGCGRSTRGLPAEQLSPEAAVADLISLLDRLEVESTDLLGFSYGGQLAQRLALTAPHRVRRLVIASSMIPRPGAVPKATHTPAWMKTKKPSASVVRTDAFASADTVVWRPAARTDYRQRVREISFSAQWAEAHVTWGLSAAAPQDALDRLARLPAPILLLHGRHDAVFPAADILAAERALPNATAQILDDAGHIAHIDQPRLWLESLALFLGANQTTDLSSERSWVDMEHGGRRA